MSSNPLYQNIFVTVGTTLFNELIDSVLDKDTIKVLYASVNNMVCNFSSKSTTIKLSNLVP